MLVRVPRVGSGTPGDPFRVLLPTWTHITDTPNGLASIVSIPDEDAPDDIDAPDTPRRPLVNGVAVLVGLTAAQRIKWRIKLARRWQSIADYSQVDVV